jgi:O-antigen/teichoic acid export membrane protein
MIESSTALPSTSTVLRGLPSVRIARHGVTALGIKLAAAGLALALQVCLARTLGHAGYGEYAYVVAWLQLLLIFAHGGFATAAVKFVAQYHTCSQNALTRGFITRSSQIVLIESIALALIMASAAMAFYQPDGTGRLGGFLMAGITLPVLAQFELVSAIVRGFGHVITGLAVSLIQPLLLLGLLTIAHFFHSQVSSSMALVMNLGAAAVALGGVFALLRHLEQDLWQRPTVKFHTRDWLGTATQMMIAQSLLYLQGRTGVIMAGLQLDPTQAGTYAAIERLADVGLLGLASVNMLVAPQFASLYAQKQICELQRFARLAAWGASVFMLLTVFPLAMFGKPILQCFGEEFVTGFPILLVLLVGVSVNALCGSVGYMLHMTGHQRDMGIAAIFALCLNLLLCLLLVPQYGILGTAVANAVAIAVCNLLMLLFVRWRLGIWVCIGNIR